MTTTNKKWTLLSVVSVSITALTTVFIAKPEFHTLALTRDYVATSSDYVNEFYCRTLIDDEEHYLTYTGGDKMETTNDPSEALFTVTFTTNTTVTIQRGSYNLGYKGTSDTALKNTSSTWDLSSGLLKQHEGSRTLLYSFSNDYGRAYSGNVGDSYGPIYFYTQDEFGAAESRCNWTDEDRSTQLENFAYNKPAPVIKYTVSFSAGEGSGTKDSIRVIENEQITTPTHSEFTAPTGKEFDAWYIGETEVSFPLTITEDITLTAHWKESTGSWQDATMTGVTEGTSCTVNGINGIKVGTSKKGGAMSITVPGTATELKFYAAAWNGVNSLSLNISGITHEAIALTSDSGIANNNPFTLNGSADNYLQEITLSISEETTITFTGSSAKRFVVWGAQYK